MTEEGTGIFSPKNRENYLRLLDARRLDDMMNYDYDRNFRGLHGLERLAKRYKRDGDRKSLREVVRLLVSASGHDIHEIRNRANVILERVMAPKEFDAPLATTFCNVHLGDTFDFSFSLPDDDQVLLSMRMAGHRLKSIGKKLGLRTERVWSRCRQLGYELAERAQLDIPSSRRPVRN